MPDNEDDDDRPYKVGRGKPPLDTRFKKGATGNKKGRPKGSGKKIPFDFALTRPVTIQESGTERSVDAEEAFLLYLRKREADGDPTAQKLYRKSLNTGDELDAKSGASRVKNFAVLPIAPGSPNGAFLALNMGVMHDAFRPTARIYIQPWLVEAALRRLGDRRLSLEEQATILKATRTPKKVKWPDWWEVFP